MALFALRAELFSLRTRLGGWRPGGSAVGRGAQGIQGGKIALHHGQVSGHVGGELGDILPRDDERLPGKRLALGAHLGQAAALSSGQVLQGGTEGAFHLRRAA